MERDKTMVKAGDTLHNPLSGETFVILKTSADTGGALFQMETQVPAIGGPHIPPHLHPAHTMRLTVLQGQLKFWMGKPDSEKLYEPGAQLTIPINTPYHWTRAGHEELRFVTELEPAGEWEFLFESLCAIGQAASEKKLHPVLASLSVLHRRRNHLYFSMMPIAVQQALFAGVASLARLAGYRDHYACDAQGLVWKT